MIKIKIFSFITFFLLILIPLSFLEARTRRAFLVGIDDYEPPARSAYPSELRQWTNLRGCINDVENMEAILQSSIYRFKPHHIHTLKNKEATRKNIISTFKRVLIKNVSAGDTCIFYFAGHGSRVGNSASREVDRMDETLVPADWYRPPVSDIRDKELKALFNQVLDKKAHLTVIIDACHSGSISRGIPMPLSYRSMPPAQPGIEMPTTPAEAPAKRGALIFTAARDFQAAVETRDRNNQWRGLFSMALHTALKNNGSRQSAHNIILKVKAFMHIENQYQEPNLEGLPQKVKKNILGLSVRDANPAVQLAVSRIIRRNNRPPLIVLMGGLALGVRENCRLKPATPRTSDADVMLRVHTVNGLNRCTARLVKGKISQIKPGDLFQIHRWVLTRETPMKVILPVSPYTHQALTALSRKISRLKQSNRIHWIHDPTRNQPTHIISWHNKQWQLQTLNPKHSLPLGVTPSEEKILKELFKTRGFAPPKPRLYLQLPLSRELAGTLRNDLGDYSHSIKIATPSGHQLIHYLLVGRMTPDGIQYCWLAPNMPRQRGNHFPLPAATAWINPIAGFQGAAEKLSDALLKLVRIRGWQLLASPPDSGKFPYKLALRNSKTRNITSTGPLLGGQRYGLVLTADTASMKHLKKIQQRYVYVFSIDSNGKGTLLFPDLTMRTTENCFPLKRDRQKKVIQLGDGIKGGRQKKMIQLGGDELFNIAEPYGMDTYILITTTDALSHPGVLNFSGVRRQSIPGNLSPFESLLYDLKTVSRKPGYHTVPVHWSVASQSIVSQAKTD